MADSRVDNIAAALKGLKQERICLERKLQEQRKRRENLERTVDAMKTKCCQVQDTNAKLMATLKVAQHKVAQTQTHSQALQEQVELKRTQVQSLNKEIENARQSHHAETETYGLELDGITVQLLDLKQINSGDHVMNMMQTYDCSFSDNLIQVEKAESEINQLILLLEELKIKKDKAATSAEQCGAPLWQQKMVLDIFEEKISRISHSLDMFEAKQNELQTDRDQLLQQKDELQAKLETMA